ncbi:MAG TPA: hypothetical protein DIU07_16620 [Rhodobacteraceae bacterium]|nr:hypothetical protein [Paracoccaceae bacterium]
MARQFIPFDKLWNLQVPVPYSGLVIDGDRAWSAGLLPLDTDGDVRFPANPIEQARVIISYAKTLLEQGGLKEDAVSRVVLYLAPHETATIGRLVEMFSEAFDRDTLVETVPVPHFHYGGALIQADIFCSPSEPVTFEDLPGGGHVRVKREGGLILMNLTAPVETLGRAVGGLLHQHELSPGQLLSGWGIAPEPVLAAVPGQIAPRLPGFFSGALMPCYNIFDKVHLYLTFSQGMVDIVESREENVRLHLADTGDIAVLDGRYLGGAAVPLAQQTRVVMDGLAVALLQRGLSFANVVKSTTFFSDGNTVDEMHANMRIRKSFYPNPGPASTSVPIARMADPGAKARIELVLRPLADG